MTLSPMNEGKGYASKYKPNELHSVLMSVAAVTHINKLNDTLIGITVQVKREFTLRHRQSSKKRNILETK